jgi:hypothetical protein
MPVLVKRVSLFLLTAMFISQLFAQSGDQNKLTIEQFSGKRVPSGLLKRTDINFDNVSAEEAIAGIAGENDLTLSYNKSALPMYKKVTVHLKNVYVLEGILSVVQEIGSMLQITKNGNLVIIPNENRVLSKKADIPKSGKIFGTVMDSLLTPINSPQFIRNKTPRLF